MSNLLMDRSEGGFPAREKQRGLVRAIVEGDLFLSARSSFFLLLLSSFFSSRSEPCLEIGILVGGERCF